MKIKSNAILLLLLVQVCFSASAQLLQQDNEVRKGVLPNGLTYYIRHNAKTPKIADFYIAQRVGSILEEPRQRGLAHFLEHMAFNGTEHFPGNDKGKGVVGWCESVGIKFGKNLNAYTSCDETVYNIASAPTSREGVVDSCLLVLHDWSNSLLLDGAEIDKERGVIHEEWRSRRSGMALQRMLEDVISDIFKGTKYEDCLPIGDMNIVDNFPYKDLRDYYHKWYRPDLQAVIVVGDIDVDKVEKKITDLFSTIKKPVNAAERIYFPVNDNDSIIVATATDKEQPTVNVMLYMKNDPTPDAEKGKVGYLAGNFRESLVLMMLNSRLGELSVLPNPPFISTSIRSGKFIVAATKDALSANVVCKEDDIKGGVTAMVGELERARINGFTATEMGRAVADYMKRMDKMYNERDKRENGSYVKEYLNNFLESEPLISREYRYELMKKIAKETTLEQVNETARQLIADKNQVLCLYGPEKEGLTLPGKQELAQMVLDAQSAHYDAYVDNASNGPLMENLPQPGKIVSEKKFDSTGVTQLTLSNGVKVYVKPTTLAADNISMNMFSLGGSSLYPDSDIPNLHFLKGIITSAGVGSFDAVSLKKALAGKNVKVEPFVVRETEGVKGSSSKKDLKTMFELTHLYFTAPRKDTDAFESFVNKQRSFIANRSVSAKVVYNDSLNLILYGNKERVKPTTVETLEKVDYDRVLEIYKDRFADASDFSMILVGNVDIDSLRPLLCQYIATLPAINRKETFRNIDLEIRPVDETHIFERSQTTPSSLVSIFYTGKVAYNAKNDLIVDVMAQALRLLYTEKVREEQGGTYGVSVSGELQRYPAQKAMIYISFRTDPSKYSTLIPIVYAQLELMASEGPSEENLAKIKEYLLKTYRQSVMTNGYWDYVIYNKLYNNVDFDADYEKLVNNLTTKDVRNFAKKMLNQKRRIEVTMTTDKL